MFTVGRRIAEAACCLLALALGGCATLESVTSGHVGCPAKDIRIFDARKNWDTMTWTAKCRGRVYYCSQLASRFGGADVACKDAAPAPQPTKVAPSGCQYDSQCKGDRICQDGRCMDPP